MYFSGPNIILRDKVRTQRRKERWTENLHVCTTRVRKSCRQMRQKKENALKEGMSLFEDGLIFNDDVITGLWVRYHKLYVLLVRSVLIMRPESIRGSKRTPKNP